MTVEWHEGDLIAKGMSTRPMCSSTGEVVRLSLEALEGMAEQVRTGFIPIVIEHLSILPPSGRWHHAEIVEADDGAQELVLRGRLFRTLSPSGDDPDPLALLPPGRSSADVTPVISSIGFEPRNFDPMALEHARKSAPVEVEEEHRWSELPPLEWTLAVPVIWGATKFMGSFLDEIGRESARAIVKWIANLATHAKDAHRDRIIALQFELPGGDPIGPLIYGFVPIEPTDDITARLLPALEAATDIAELAGAQAELRVMGDLKQAAFIWKDDKWRLAWSVVDDDAVRVTNWFLANEPDPARFLGRPLLGDLPTREV